MRHRRIVDIAGMISVLQEHLFVRGVHMAKSLISNEADTPQPGSASIGLDRMFNNSPRKASLKGGPCSRTPTEKSGAREGR